MNVGCHSPRSLRPPFALPSLSLRSPFALSRLLSPTQRALTEECLPSTVCGVVTPDQLHLKRPHFVVNLLDADLSRAHVAALVLQILRGRGYHKSANTHTHTHARTQAPFQFTSHLSLSLSQTHKHTSTRMQAHACKHTLCTASQTFVPRSFMRASASSRRLPCSTPEDTSGIGMSLQGDVRVGV